MDRLPVTRTHRRATLAVGLGLFFTDLLPPRFRGRYIAWAYTFAFCGVPVVGFLAKGITEGEFLGNPGWRWMFVIGAIGALVVFLLRRGLPESPRWLESAGRQEEAEAVVAELEREARAEGHTLDEPAPAAPVAAPTAVATDVPRQSGRVRSAIGDLFVAPYKRRTTMMVIFHIFQTIGYYGFGTMVPLVLVAKGYPVSTSLLFTALTYLGYPLGSALSLPLVERFERKFLVIGSLVVMAVLGLAFGSSSSMALILVFGFLYTAVSNVFSNAYHIYQAEIFPTQLRSTASSGTYALSRLATAAMPFVLVPLLNSAGVASMFAVVVAAVVIVAINVAVLGPRTTGRTLEAVNSPAGGH